MRFALELVPLHTPRPLRDPLPALGLGCLRTRAIYPPRPAGLVVRLRGGFTFTFTNNPISHLRSSIFHKQKGQEPFSPQPLLNFNLNYNYLTAFTRRNALVPLVFTLASYCV